MQKITITIITNEHKKEMKRVKTIEAARSIVKYGSKSSKLNNPSDNKETALFQHDEL